MLGGNLGSLLYGDVSVMFRDAGAHYRRRVIVVIFRFFFGFVVAIFLTANSIWIFF